MKIILFCKILKEDPGAQNGLTLHLHGRLRQDGNITLQIKHNLSGVVCGNTTVEGSVEKGHLTKLTVTPKERAKDVVVFRPKP